MQLGLHLVALNANVVAYGTENFFARIRIGVGTKMDEGQNWIVCQNVNRGYSRSYAKLRFEFMSLEEMGRHLNALDLIAQPIRGDHPLLDPREGQFYSLLQQPILHNLFPYSTSPPPDAGVARLPSDPMRSPD